MRVQRLWRRDAVGRDVVGELGNQLLHGLGAGVTDALQRRDEVGRLDPILNAVDAPAAIVALQDPGEDQVEEELRLRDVEPLPGQIDRGLDELRPRHAPEPAMRLLETGDEARNGHRALTDVVALRRVAEVDGEVLDLAEWPSRRGEEAIEHGHLAVDPGEQEAAARRAGQGAFGHGRGKRGYDAGVDRIAAFREHARACLGGDSISRGDRSLHELRVKMWPRCR